MDQAQTGLEYKEVTDMGVPELQLIYVSCTWETHIYGLPLKYYPIRTLNPVMTVDYIRPSLLWSCDIIPQENQPAPWQIHAIVLLDCPGGGVIQLHGLLCQPQCFGQHRYSSMHGVSDLLS